MSKRDYLSYSALKAFAKSPNHYIRYVQGKIESTPAMDFGTMVHKAILEPEDFEECYAPAPYCDRRTKVGKQTWMEFSAKCEEEDIIPVKEIDFNRALRMRDAVWANEDCESVLEFTASEIGFTNEIDGVPFKGFFDAYAKNHVVDIKTTGNASFGAFQKACSEHDYYLQATIYSCVADILAGNDEGDSRTNFFWIAVERDPPYNVAVYRFDPMDFWRVREKLTYLIGQFVNWDGEPATYFDGIQRMTLPSWWKDDFK
jgi:exodeoxyribonuclease VIII